MSALFAEHYRKHVVPRLRELCRRHGILVALDLEGFVAAHVAILDEARRLGLGYLPRYLAEELEDKTRTWLLEAEIAAEPIRIEAYDRANRIAAQGRRYS